jgi:hypothetical protein
VDSLLSDDLLRQLMAAGQVDVVVGVPTLDNAGTVGGVVRAVHHAFTGPFKRDRTVLLNLDAGSQDGTPDIVRRASLVESDTVVAPHAFRTVHRITSPYHGLPGKGGALRALFAAAELLDAKVVALVDPDVVSLTEDWVTRLVRPVLRDGFDYVAPIFTRHPAEGPLVTQLARPLVRAAYGYRMHEPLSSEFGCSARFASHCLAQDVWSSPFLNHAIDIWLSTTALSGSFRCGESVLGPRLLSSPVQRPALPELFSQVVGALFTCLEMHQSYWLERSGSEPLPLLASGPMWSPDRAALDPAPLAESFRSGVRDLRPVLERIFEGDTLGEIERAADAEGPAPPLPDALWTDVVGQFTAAHHREVMHRSHLISALVPLYLGRTAAFLAENAGREAPAIEERLEALSQGFEAAKPNLVRLWNAGAER